VGVRLVPVTLLAGIALAVGTVAVHQWWWGLLLGAAATLLVEVATPAGWATRLPLALTFDLTVGLVAVPKGEGDYLVAATGPGYAVLGVALLVLCLAIATLPRPGRGSAEKAETAGPEESPDNR
jgi:hypothetical protein